MEVKISKSMAKGVVKVPPSKSYAHRYLIAGMLANNNTIVKNVDLSNDIYATLNALKILGAQIDKHNDRFIFKSFNKQNIIPDLNAFESGSTLRFLIPISMVFYDHFIIRGTEKLFSRGLEIYEEIFKDYNIQYCKTINSIEIFSKLQPGHYRLKGNISSQYLTGLLLSLPLLDGDSIIEVFPPIESKSYIDITKDTLEKFGIKIDVSNDYTFIKIYGKQKYNQGEYFVEGDYSNAAFLDVFNYFNGDVKLEGLNPSSYQGDKIYQKYFDMLNKESTIIDLGNAIDLGPIMFVFASLKYGAHFINTRRLKIKESDRINATIAELSKIGVEARILDNEVYIYPAKYLKEVTFDGHNDHRIVMALSLVLSLVGGSINGAEAVEKSYPHFFDDLRKLGIEVN